MVGSNRDVTTLPGTRDKVYSYRCHKNGSVLDYQTRDAAWLSSPDIHTAYSDIGTNWKYRGRILQSENPLKPLCNFCYKPAYFNERISISNLIFHRSCFRCRRCKTHLSFKNCVLHHKKLYCEVHIRSKIWKSVQSIGESASNRALYGGIKSAKQRLVKTDKPSENTNGVKNGPPEPKRITPPREGVAVGVLESTPSERDPNIVVAGQDEKQDPLELCYQTSAATRARFREMEKLAKSMDQYSNDEPNDQLGKQKDAIAVDTKSLRNRFLASANGNGDSEFQNKPKKINPAAELQELYRRESMPVNQFQRECPDGDENNVNTESTTEMTDSVVISKNRALELKKKFTNYTTETNEMKKKEFKMELGEGGIFESEPRERNEEVVASEYEKDNSMASNSVKNNLQRFKELQTQKAQPYQTRKTEPIKLDYDLTRSGVYESTPKESEADTTANDDKNSYIELIKDRKCANEAKRAILEKQKEFQNQSDEKKKSPPQMINIWQDLCSYSGVFENQPKEQSKDIVRHNSSVTKKEQEENSLNETSEAPSTA